MRCMELPLTSYCESALCLSLFFALLRMQIFFVWFFFFADGHSFIIRAISVRSVSCVCLLVASSHVSRLVGDEMDFV
jgi:cation transport ATPase